MNEFIKPSLLTIGDTTIIKQIKRIYGGKINDVFYCLTEIKAYLIKLNENVSSDFFDLEKD